VIPLPVFLVNDKNRTDLNFSHFFCELGLKMLGPQQCSEKLFRRKIFVCFCWLGLVFITLCLLFLYDFCHLPKKRASVSPLATALLYQLMMVTSADHCLFVCYYASRRDAMYLRIILAQYYKFQ
jgi:hypothetical protein